MSAKIRNGLHIIEIIDQIVLTFWRFEYCNKNALGWLGRAYAPSVKGQKYGLKPVYESHGSDLQPEGSSMEDMGQESLLSPGQNILQIRGSE